MKIPSLYDSFQVLLLQLADDGRGKVLLGDSVDRARSAAGPFMIGEDFPSVYFELPLAGDPFLDLTILYDTLAPGSRIDSEAAADTGPMLDWYAAACAGNSDISCGFELDTSKPELPRAAVHFQPRVHVELVQPFCKAIGEPERARLYLDLAERMPAGWPLSFFGMFRGRPNSPLRVCGYLGDSETAACSDDPHRLASAFEAIGFAAYDNAMLADISRLMAAAPGTVDFQFDVHADGALGDTFAIDIQFEIAQPKAVNESFESGPGARIMQLLEELGAADSRWKLTPQASFARALPIELDGGSPARYGFTLMPQWAKVRWRNGVLQPSKLYYLGKSQILGKETHSS